jgi:hypothetical protein
MPGGLVDDHLPACDFLDEQKTTLPLDDRGNRNVDALRRERVAFRIDDGDYS